MAKTLNLSEEEINQILKDKWTSGHNKGYVNVKGCMLPELYTKWQKEIDDFEVFDTDLWICSFPRTGTTWTSEMMWLIANDLNYKKAEAKLTERVRFIEFGTLCNFIHDTDAELPDSMVNSVPYAKSQPHPRFIKTHLPFQLLPKQIQTGEKKAKIIYICRNPMDVCISSYYFFGSMTFTGSLEEFCKLFLSNKALYGEFWPHILTFWKMRDQKNILFLKYEDMKQDLAGQIRKTASFLGKSFSDAEVKTLQDHLSVESMKKNPAVNDDKSLEVNRKDGKFNSPFIRKGVVGDYKREMPQNYIELFQKWTKENLEGTGLSF